MNVALRWFHCKVLINNFIFQHSFRRRLDFFINRIRCSLGAGGWQHGRQTRLDTYVHPFPGCPFSWKLTFSVEYKKVRGIGTGRKTLVWKVEHQTLGTVALKQRTLSSGAAAAAITTKEKQRELEVAERLREIHHENVTRIFDCFDGFEEGFTVFIGNRESIWIVWIFFTYYSDCTLSWSSATRPWTTFLKRTEKTQSRPSPRKSWTLRTRWARRRPSSPSTRSCTGPSSRRTSWSRQIPPLAPATSWQGSNT